MAPAVLPHISPNDLYSRDAAVAFLGSQSAYRSAYRRGLGKKVIQQGKRSYIKGADLIAFICGETDEQAR